MEASKLKEILDQHRLWIETNALKGQRASLRDANLSGANLLGATLTGASLRGANLNCANLEYANLMGASLWGANLWGANLTGANLSDANLSDAKLYRANLTGANLTGANLYGANLTGAIGLPHVSWIIPGCLVQLNQFAYGFYLEKEGKYENFIQDSIGFFIQDNSEEKTFDMLVGDRIIRGIPDWVKYSGLKQAE